MDRLIRRVSVDMNELLQRWEDSFRLCEANNNYGMWDWLSDIDDKLDIIMEIGLIDFDERHKLHWHFYEVVENKIKEIDGEVE